MPEGTARETAEDNTLEDRSEVPTQRKVPSKPQGPLRAGLRFEAVLSNQEEKLTGIVPMEFSIYDDQHKGRQIWSETRDQVIVTAGRFEVLLGVDNERLPSLPERIWLSVVVDGDELSPRSELSRYRSVIQG